MEWITRILSSFRIQSRGTGSLYLIPIQGQPCKASIKDIPARVRVTKRITHLSLATILQERIDSNLKRVERRDYL